MVVALTAVAVGLLLRSRNMLVWIGPYLRGRLKPRPPAQGTIHVLFCFVDHYEPMWNSPTREIEDHRVRQWELGYPKLADRHADSEGVKPQHTFFYPEEEYRFEHLEAIRELCVQGYGEIEVHLHHDNDTDAGLRQKLDGFCQTLSESHGALPRDPDSGKTLYAFIHGNWCLDNSAPDGRNCGVDNELEVLADTGCYADFTLPSAPDASQTRKINSIYYATETGRPKSHNDGVDVEVGREPQGDLMIIQGPLGLNWADRKWGIIPRIENGNITGNQPPTPQRVDLWVKAGIHVKGQPNWVFVKIHTHGAQDSSIDCLLGDPVDQMHSYLESRYNDGQDYCLHYVNAREMYNIVKAAESGKTGNPAQYRDFLLARPEFGQPGRSSTPL
ncbi:MAG: hypothetical protein QNJ40_19350 [Xanthomonadales bacterium]|nr:hypothetical protein [Xanthomonadales bacterium]